MNPETQEAALRVHPAAARAEYRSIFGVLRSSEWVIAAYFLYTAFMALAFDVSDLRRFAAFAVPAAYYALMQREVGRDRLWLSVVRDWLPTPLILVAYWQVEWFTRTPRLIDLEHVWLGWDRAILYDWGLRATVESLGPFIPGTLEVCYALLYAIPPFCLAALYLLGMRGRSDRFLFTFMLGTLLAYASLPHFPSASPRVEFPGLDLPSFLTGPRRFNIWLLNQGDITTSVFPSGHVANAFSAAFSMMLVVPERKWIGRALLAMALVIATATIYGRYHYVADVIAAIALSLVAVGVTVVLHRD